VCRTDQSNSGPHETGAAVSPEKIRGAIRNKYAGVSISAAGKFQYPTGKDGAEALRYDPAFIQSASPGLLESFCGVGNPFSLGKIRHCDVLLDFGCGTG
jgi:hypothetical protein